VLISFNIFIYMPTYRPYPITIFARETTNQVEVAITGLCIPFVILWIQGFSLPNIVSIISSAIS